MEKIRIEVQKLGIGLDENREFFKQSFASMVQAGNYNWVHRDITAEHFSFLAPLGHYRQVVTVTFSRCITFQEGIAQFMREGLGLGGIEHLWLVGARRPTLQLEHCVVAPGVTWEYHNGDAYVAHLRSSFKKRQVYIRDTNLSWDPRWRFVGLAS